MHLLAISLLTILAGTLLLAKVKKDMPGKFFSFVSWFFIVVGFLLFLGAVTLGICRMSCKNCCPEKPGYHQQMMMKKCGPGMPGKACGPGMDDKCCGPGPMGKGMCVPRPGCMNHDSMMKSCPRHMAGDTAKVQVQKK